MLEQSYLKARKSRKNKQEVYLFDLKIEENLLNMKNDIINRTYKHEKYKKIILYDSKKRYIYSPTFRDHILHHFVYEKIYNILDKKMVHSTFACRKWYWTHKAVLYLAKLIRKEKRKILSVCHFHKSRNLYSKENFRLNFRRQTERLYYLKIDFSKYFWTINHDLLKKKLRKYIQDDLLLYCLDVVISSYRSWCIYDDLLKEYDCYVNEKNKWLPIGWILSQLLANFYLNDLDQYLRNQLEVRFVRYMDDIVILWSKDKLQFVLKKIIEFIKKDKLILNPKKITFNTINHGITFVWYKFKNNKIWVWKRLRHSLWMFLDRLEKIDKKIFTEEDKYRIICKFYSRLGFINIATNVKWYKDKIIEKFNKS